MKQLTWEEFLALDLVGRDLVNEDSLIGLTARGPIGVVTAHGGRITIEMFWTAVSTNPLAPAIEYRWASAGPRRVALDQQRSAPPNRRPDGSIVFSVPYCGTVTILPEGDRLDPARVEGLADQPAA